MGKTENKLTTNDAWGTSAELLEQIAPLGPITLDPCSHPESIVRSEVAYLLPRYRYARDAAGELAVPLRELDDLPRPAHAKHVVWGDGMVLSWSTPAVPDVLFPQEPLVYVNPPYSELGRWLEKATQTNAAGARVLMLAPIRSGNVEWGPANTADLRCDLPRQTFLGATSNAPFHLCLLYWGTGEREDFREAYATLRKIGHTWINPDWARPTWEL